MLTDTDAEEIHRAMMADETKVHDISVNNIDIYKATMGMEVPAKIMNKAGSSIGNLSGGGILRSHTRTATKGN